MRLRAIAVALPTLAAGLAQAQTTYTVPDSDITIDFGGGEMLDAELRITEDAQGAVTELALTGYHYSSSSAPLSVTVSFGDDGLLTASQAWSFDQARAPRLSAVGGGAAPRITRESLHNDRHEVNWETTPKTVYVIVEAGLGGWLVTEGLIAGGSPDADGLLAFTLAARLAFADGVTGPTYTECKEDAVASCSIDCNGVDLDGVRDCLDTFSWSAEGGCSWDCMTEAECCPSE